jgi:hypothetical protein
MAYEICAAGIRQGRVRPRLRCGWRRAARAPMRVDFVPTRSSHRGGPSFGGRGGECLIKIGGQIGPLAIRACAAASTCAWLAQLRPIVGCGTMERTDEFRAWTLLNGGPNGTRRKDDLAGIRWDLAADALDMLLSAGVVEKALGLGWDARELVGVCRAQPHDSPSRAGLIWSVKPGDTIPDVRRSGCIIAYGNVRHIWKRAPIGADICLPWELIK